MRKRLMFCVFIILISFSLCLMFYQYTLSKTRILNRYWNKDSKSRFQKKSNSEPENDNKTDLTTVTNDAVNNNVYAHEIIQTKFHKLQNPTSCENARKFVCKVRTLCGLGCELHHLGICMFIALGTNRTLITDIVRLQPWLDSVFEPLSNSCQPTRNDILKKNYPQWKPEGTDHIKDVQLNVNNAHGRHTVYVPGSLPLSLLPDIWKFNRDPVVWWIGQVMAYICRFTPAFKQEVESYQKRLGLDSEEVIVGLQIRRTDKITTKEGKLQSNERYMQYVAEWFDKRETRLGTKIKRRVYLATDDVTAIDNLRKSYPNYTFICDESIPKKSIPSRRVSLAGIKGIMLDLTALSRCNFVVCTFSSNIGRFVYELMQSNRADPSDDIISLDIRYDYPIPHDRLFTGTLDHRIRSLAEKYTKPIDPFGIKYPNFEEALTDN